jgi:hypothetical protein
VYSGCQRLIAVGKLDECVPTGKELRKFHRVVGCDQPAMNNLSGQIMDRSDDGRRNDCA